jgi:hypothetical protein
MKTFLGIVLTVVAGLLCIGIGVMLTASFHVTWKAQIDINPAEFITIILTAVSVMLVILTIFLAVFGVIGIASINERLREHSMNYFTNELKDGRPAFDLLKRVVRNVVYEGVDPIPEDSAGPTTNAGNDSDDK